MATCFPYAERAAAARQARLAVRPACRALTNRWDDGDPRTIAWRSAIKAHWAAVSAAYPPGYRKAFEGLRSGDGWGVDLLIEFLEADPIFFRSGYQKVCLIQHLKRTPLKPEQAERLRGVVRLIVLTRDAREFRHYCRLAHRVDTPALRDGLGLIANGSDKARRRRAIWMLEALEQARRTARGCKADRSAATP